MINKLNLNPPFEQDGETILEAALHGPRHQRTLRFQIPTATVKKFGLTKLADPFVLASSFRLMADGLPVQVRGTVSSRLLRNLEEYMRMWQAWQPEKYRAVTIEAEHELSEPAPSPGQPALLCFSGGLDSCYSTWRHHHNLAGRATLPLTAGVFVHGADIPLTQRRIYDHRFELNRKILDSLGMDLLGVRTNARDLELDWRDAHAAVLAGCMTLFNCFGWGLLATSMPYQWFGQQWGSTPWTDHLLSSSGMQIASDGADCPRSGKLEKIRDWPEIRQYLHVCWEDVNSLGNCCKCEKCIRTILTFLACGSSQPPCFPHTLLAKDILQLKLNQEVLAHAMQMVLNKAVENGLEREPLFKASARLLRRHRRWRWLDKFKS